MFDGYLPSPNGLHTSLGMFAPIATHKKLRNYIGFFSEHVF
jgi:hypothetical protein